MNRSEVDYKLGSKREALDTARVMEDLHEYSTGVLVPQMGYYRCVVLEWWLNVTRSAIHTRQL